MNTPIITPVTVPSGPSRCPKCGGLENKRVLCVHCGYEYENVEFHWWYIPVILGIIGFVIYVIFTLLVWGVGDEGFIEIFRYQLHWIVNKKIL